MSFRRRASGLWVPEARSPADQRFWGGYGAGRSTTNPPAQGAEDPEPWFEEDFASYSSTANMKADPNGWYGSDENQAQMFLDQAVSAPGLGLTQSMRYDWPNNAGSDYSITRIIQLASTVTEIWVESYERYSSSFTTDGPNGGNQDYKAFFLHTLPDGSGRFQWKVGVGSTAVSPALPITSGDLGGAPYQEMLTDVFCVSEDDDPGNGNIWDDTWHRYRIHVKLESGGGGNGILQFWFDDTLYFDEHNCNFTPAYTGIDWLYLGANLNRGTGRVMSRWFGRERAWITDPGWT